MKRKLIAMIAIFLAVFTLSAATFHSVPLDNEASLSRHSFKNAKAVSLSPCPVTIII